MSPITHAPAPPTRNAFAMPPARRRIGAGAEQPPGRFWLMLAVAFLLASPLITLLLALP